MTTMMREENEVVVIMVLMMMETMKVDDGIKDVSCAFALIILLLHLNRKSCLLATYGNKEDESI